MGTSHTDFDPVWPTSACHDFDRFLSQLQVAGHSRGSESHNVSSPDSHLRCDLTQRYRTRRRNRQTALPSVESIQARLEQWRASVPDSLRLSEQLGPAVPNILLLHMYFWVRAFVLTLLTTELLMIISRTATQGEGLPSPPMDDVCDAAATRIIQLLEVSITEGHC
jgi:hypothetical protein